jgi:multidrug efflux pump subunit AcrB
LPWYSRPIWDTSCSTPSNCARFRAKHGGDIYDSGFYRRLRALVVWCLRHRWLVIGVTAGLFVLSLLAFNGAVQKQFFPPANRPEIMVDIWLPQGSSLKATEREVKRLEALIDKDENIVSWSSYVGNSAPRFFLSLDQQLYADNFGQMVIVTRGLKERDAVKSRLEAAFGAPTAPGRICCCAWCAWRTGRRSLTRCSSASSARTSRPCATARKAFPA